MEKYKDEAKNDYSGILVIPCSDKITYGFISQSGKSFVYRERINKKGDQTNYKSKRLPFAITSLSNGFYNSTNIFKHDFGNGLENSIRIAYHKI